MAVYKEFFQAVQTIQSNTFTLDGSDIRGAVTNGNDEVWAAMQQLAQYGVKGTRTQTQATHPNSVIVHLVVRGIDEWAVSDERMTVKEATVEYMMCYFEDSVGIFLNGKRYRGVVFLDPIKKTEDPRLNEWEKWELRDIEFRMEHEDGMRNEMGAH